MCVKRSVAKTAAASVDATTAPSRIASSHERSKSACAATPGQERADDDADGAQQRGRHGDLAQPAPGRLQPALVEDQREADDADLARELRVVELDPARAVRAEQHPEPEERHEDGQSRACRAERDDDARREHGADERRIASLRPLILLAVRRRSCRGRRNVAQDRAGPDDGARNYGRDHRSAALPKRWCP